MTENFVGGVTGTVCTTGGAEVRASGPVRVAALRTVSLPVFVPVPPVFRAGLGAENVAVAPVTVNAPVRTAFPFGVVTVTVLAPSAVLAAMAQVALTVVALGSLTPVQVTPAPDTVTAVA